MATVIKTKISKTKATSQSIESSAIITKPRRNELNEVEVAWLHEQRSQPAAPPSERVVAILDFYVEFMSTPINRK